IETHRERFHEVWQSGLVIATTGPEPTGGFFRLLPGSGGSNGMLIPFDEIVEDDGLLPGGRKRTLIDWANYRTEQPVEGDRSERRPHMPPPRRATPDPRDPALANMTSQPTLPVMLPEPSEFDDLPLEPQPEVRRYRLGTIAMLALVAGFGATGYWWWNARNRGEIGGLGSLLSSPPASSAAAGNRLRDTSVYNPPQDTAGLGAGGSMSAPATQPATQPAAQPPAPVPNAAAVPSPNAAPPAATDAKTRRFDALADSLAVAIR